MPAYELVGVPVGRDSKHGRYWNFGDMRLYKETPEMKTRDSEWATVCVEAEEWIDQLRAFERSSSVHDKKMGVWLAEVLPGMMELLEKREVNRRRLEVSSCTTNNGTRCCVINPSGPNWILAL